MVLHHHQWRLLAIELHILQTSHTFCCSLSLSSLELISFCCSSTNADSCTSCFLCSSSSVSCSSILSSYCSSFCFCLSLNSPAISDMRAAAPARSLLNACTTSPWLSACFLAWVASRLKKKNYILGVWVPAGHVLISPAPPSCISLISLTYWDSFWMSVIFILL